MAKTHTSTDVKRRYNEKTYKRIHVQFPNAFVDDFKYRCEKLGISQASVIKDAIEQFLMDTEEEFREKGWLKEFPKGGKQ